VETSHDVPFGSGSRYQRAKPAYQAVASVEEAQAQIRRLALEKK
jgi:hypothetical protein